MMMLVPFWRTSLSDPNSTRQQIYIKHFEIHPIKIIASFVPGNLNTSYSPSQEALRSFLHNVIKLRRAGSNILFAAITEISDSILRGAETSGFSGMVKGFHQGILNLAMEPTLISSAFMEGGPSRRIKLDHSPGMNEAYIEGYLQAMLDMLYKLEYLKVRVIDDEVLLKNLPPNSSLISDIVEHVKGFLIREGLLKGESNASSLSNRRLYGGQEWKFGPMLLTLSEHLFVSFAIRFLRKQASKVVDRVRSMRKERAGTIVLAPSDEDRKEASRKQALGKFVLLSILAYIDGRLCRCIPNAIARRIVSGFLLNFLDENDKR